MWTVHSTLETESISLDTKVGLNKMAAIEAGSRLHCDDVSDTISRDKVANTKYRETEEKFNFRD